jgi:hypothetical protein
VSFNLQDYEPVAARLDRWLKADHKTHQPSVRTFLVSDPSSDICVFRAELWLLGETKDDDYLLSTGWAEEIRGAGNVNRTSHVENCETSAVGRALANAGMAGSDVSKRPSREEMTKVQNTAPKMRITQASSAMAEANGISIKGNQHGPIPDWLVLEAAQAGVSQVWDNRDKVAGTKRPWFKDVNGDKAFWPPRGTPDPIVATHEDDLSDPGEEEPF